MSLSATPSMGELANHLDLSGNYDVDNRLWRSIWRNRWVAFVDLIAFAEVSIKSRDTSINLILRFHRALKLAEDQHTPAKVLRFADSAYVMDADLNVILKFCSDVQHTCLAMNGHYLNRFDTNQATGRSRPPEWYHMVLPRITISYGNTLTPPTSRSTRILDQTTGLDLESLLIGSALVNAYRIEHHTGGTMIAVDRKQWSRASRSLNRVRGNASGARSKLDKWSSDPKLLMREGVVEVPWLLMRATQPNDKDLWADDWKNVPEKLRLFHRVWMLFEGDFVRSQFNPSVGKQHATALRHLSSVVQLLRNSASPQAWDYGRLHHELQQL